MHNATIIGIYTPFCIVTAVIFCIELLRHYKRQEDYLFTLLCFYALGWYVTSICGLLTENLQTARFCNNFMLVFVCLIPPTLLQFIVKFYKIKLPFKSPKFGWVCLYIIPALTFIVILTSGSHSLLVTKLEFISLSPVREMVLVWGPWFWVHTVYSYILSVVIIVLIVTQHLRVSRFYRLPSTMMVLGVGITLLGNVVTLFQIIPPAIEPTLISMSLSVIFFSLAIFNNNHSKFVRFSKAHIYHYLAEYILVLDEKNQIIDYNRAAAQWFEAQGISLHSSNLEAVTRELDKIGEFIKNDLEGEDGGVDVYIKDNMFTQVLNKRIYQMKDPRGESIGKIVVFSDVTENRNLIERLETKAGMDSLTGLPNHMAYSGAKARLDEKEYLPLSVVMCDANKLKQTNDSLGHEYGDALLQRVAETLEIACPKEGFVARIGGDEFIFLLPNTELAAAQAMIVQLNERFLQIDDLPFEVSVAFGAAVKEREQEDLEKIIADADASMYRNKKQSSERLSVS